MKLHELLDVIGGIPVSITDVGRWKKICEDKTAFDVFDLPEYQEVKDFKVVQVDMEGSWMHEAYESQLRIDVTEEGSR